MVRDVRLNRNYWAPPADAERRICVKCDVKYLPISSNDMSSWSSGRCGLCRLTKKEEYTRLAETLIQDSSRNYLTFEEQSRYWTAIMERPDYFQWWGDQPGRYFIAGVTTTFFNSSEPVTDETWRRWQGWTEDWFWAESRKSRSGVLPDPLMQGEKNLQVMNDLWRTGFEAQTLLEAAGGDIKRRDWLATLARHTYYVSREEQLKHGLLTIAELLILPFEAGETPDSRSAALLGVGKEEVYDTIRQHYPQVTGMPLDWACRLLAGSSLVPS